MYVPLKVTTDYSILQSLIKIKDLINFCVKNNLSSCAICDTNLFGVMEFYKLAQENNIKPIIGLEISINKSPIYLYAENFLGYKNLLKINTIISEREISIYELQNLAHNILVIVPFISVNLMPELNFFKHIYAGYQNEKELKFLLLSTSNVVYVNDIKMLNLKDQEYMQYLDLIAGKNKEDYTNNYFDYAALSKADLDNIDKVVSLLNVELKYEERYIPKYCDNSWEFLSNLCLKGLKKRLKGNVTKEYLDRLKYELNIIHKMGFVDYFLIVYDYVLYAKKNGILVGPGRGSAAGSLVSYVIGITDIDPLKYNLLFERFLNYERVSMPDIDIDFDNTKREQVINYVKEKYGELNVSGGMTFTTFKTRLVIREVGKLLNIDERLLNKFLKVLDKDKNLQSNLNNEDVKKYLNSYKELNHLYNIAMHLEGLKRNISTHAAGIVIASKPLDEIIPMYKNNDVYLTGIGMEYLEDIGLLKMDFLALKNLSMISNIINRIPNFNLSSIPLDDPLVYDLFCTAKTDGIFQFETPSFKSMLVKFKPRNFSELIASIALVRPGPSKELATYIKRKDGQEKITYYDNSLKDILEETYGVIVYQEQVINILVRMAKFSYAEADNIRRAMSKKKMDIIVREKENFLKRCVENGYELNLAQNIFEHILAFASYGFNKSHSVSYALVSYQMAYLKVHFKALFIFEMLDNALGSIDKVNNYLSELKQANLKIAKVSVNKSELNFILQDNIIYLPFKMIKNMPDAISSKIIEERNINGPYGDIFDFFRRTNLFISKKEYIMLINAEALKEFNLNNKTLMVNLDNLINYGHLYNDLKEDALIPDLEEEMEYDDYILRENELTSYGFYITNHPASKYVGNNICKLDSVKKNVFKNVFCYVLVEDIKKIKTKKNDDMAFLEGSDETGKCDFTIFPKNYYLLQNIAKNDMIKVWGNVTKRYDKYSIVISNIEKE